MFYKDRLKFYKKYLCIAIMISCFFANLENVLAAKITFNSACVGVNQSKNSNCVDSNKWKVATCYTNDQGKISQTCANILKDVCARWSPYNVGTPETTTKCGQSNRDAEQWTKHYCADNEHDYCGCISTNCSGNTICEKNGGSYLTDFVFTEDQTFYCASGSSINETPENHDKCYVCKDEGKSNIMKWTADGTADSDCSKYEVDPTIKAEADCKAQSKEVCYQCKGKTYVKKWVTESVDELVGDVVCQGGYEVSSINTKSECKTSVCYVCRNQEKTHIMKWQNFEGDTIESNASDVNCTDGYIVEPSITEERKCRSKEVCYQCIDEGKNNEYKIGYNDNAEPGVCNSYEFKSENLEECKPPEETLTCASVATNGVIWSSNNKVSGETQCSSNPEQSIANFKQCKGYNVSSNNTSNSYIYVSVDNGDCSGSGNKIFRDEDGVRKYYARVTVTTNILINQKAKFYFKGINEPSVRAGKGFTIGETNYENEITWIIADLDKDGKPFYNYNYKVQKLVSNSCISDVDFSLRESGRFYYYDEDGVWRSTTSLKDASFAVINKVVDKSYLSDSSGNYTNIKFKSYDSNDSNDRKFKSVNGIWENIRNEGSIVKGDGFNTSDVSVRVNSSSKFGKTVTREYEYNLAQSAVKVVGDDYAKALYAEDAEDAIAAARAINTGEKFYIDFKWVYGGYWPFNIGKNNSNANTDSVNPSLVDGMTWDLTGTCGVNVEDGYYKDADGDVGLNYRYRSISLKNPFPKANQTTFDDITAINWRNWFGDININANTNRNRIYNTLNYNYDYSLRFSKLSSEIISISDIKEISNSKGYGSYEGFNPDGSSQFLITNFSTGININDQYYCGLGFFSEDCNKYLGEGG